MRKILLSAAVIVFAFGSFLASCAAQAKPVSKTATVGNYSVTLKILPAESFTGAHAEMVWNGGARPNLLNSTPKPDHHMVAFVKKNGKPVADATVHIRYRRLGAHGPGGWNTLPVVRMYVKGKGRATTHFGNNVHLPAGNYAVRVTVNKAPSHVFQVGIGNH